MLNGRSVERHNIEGTLVMNREGVVDLRNGVGNEDDNNCNVRKHIYTSWERCIKYDLSPQDSPKLQKISDSQLKLLTKKYDVLRKVLEQYVAKIDLILPKNNCIVGLGNEEGILIYVDGHAPELERMGYQPGYVHTELNMGNNALGTCIFTKEPTVIFGSEHYLKAFENWAGFAAPIFDVDDELKAVFLIMLPMQLANQNILGMVMVAARGIEKELRLMHEKYELVNANEMLSEFGEGIINTASMLSHEVKNSISNISAYIQLLQMERILDNSRAEKILSEVSRINKLLYDFKRLTKPIKVNFSRCLLNDALRSTVEIMKPKINIHGVRLRISIPEEPIYIKADKNALQQVFVNLIENAIQAMEEGGMLYINLERCDKTGDIAISFKDTGPGISEEQMSQIFKLFYTTKETGSGLGLSICQSIIKYHGGDIKVDSIVGQGTTFTITFPGDKTH